MGSRLGIMNSLSSSSNGCVPGARPAQTQPVADHRREQGRVPDSPSPHSTRLGRLRYFGAERWGYSFCRYSNEQYELAVFPSGNWFGSSEEAFDIGAAYLREDWL